MPFLIDTVFEESLKYLDEMPKAKRKEIGQFFTSVETARYMASMFDSPKKQDITVLDAGAGSGILTAAAVERLQTENVSHIKVVCYETSEDVLPMLKSNLSFLKEKSVVPLDYEIKEENYITTQSSDFNESMFSNPDAVKYDWIIGNPPYKKIPKDAVEVRKRMMDYLREKNVSFKEDPKYEIHQSNFSSDFLNHWDQDDQFSRKSR